MKSVILPVRRPGWQQVRPGRLKKHTFLYTWQDIHIFAKLRGINLSDTAHVSVNRYVDASRDMPLWEIDVRDSVQPDKVKVILVHGKPVKW